MNAEAGGEPRPATPGGATPGELLRTERERRGLTLQQAAEDLHLDPWMIEALEANRFLALGAPVYAKGHLRKYAALLGLSADTIMERYEALSDTPVVPTPIPATVAAPVHPERRSMKVPLWLGIALLIGAAAWGVFEVWTGKPAEPTRESAPMTAEPEAAPVAAAQAPQVAVESAPAAAASQPVAAPPTEERKPAASPSTRDTVASRAAGTAGVVAAGAGIVRVRLEFSEASWTEIYDASGNRIMFDMGAPGRVRSVSGVAPLRVTLGYASGVTLQVNDRPLAIPRRPGKDAARFTVAADGSVSP